MNDFHAHSFEPTRRRDAPSFFDARTTSGEARRVELDVLTLVVAVKASCDGCLAFLRADLSALRGVRVIVVAAEANPTAEWDDLEREVLLAPEALRVLGLNGAPYFALVDARHRVEVEGALFSAAQVASEIESYLAG